MSAVVRRASDLGSAVLCGGPRWRFPLCVGVVLAVAMTAGASGAWAASPSCSVVLPTAGQSLSGNVALDASAPNAVRVQYYLDGVDLGPAYPTIYGWLYSPNNTQTWGWDTASVSNGSYSLVCVATASDGTTATSAPVTVTVANPGGCAVLLPRANQAVSGVTVLDAAAPPGTTQVNFFLHTLTHADVLIGPAYATGYGWLYSPNSRQTWGWDSSQVANGQVSITCEAIQPNNGATLSSTAVPVSLSNTQTIRISAPTAPNGLRVKLIMRWHWDLNRRTHLRWVKVRHLPPRATVEVSCRGRGCPKQLVSADVSRLGWLLRSLERRTYWAGDLLAITISEPGYRAERIWIRIRNHHVPAWGLF